MTLLTVTVPRIFRVSDFESLNYLGDGGFGEVYEAIFKPKDEKVAVKILRAAPHMTNDLNEKCRHEVEMLK